jgi:hypothetical protein
MNFSEKILTPSCSAHFFTQYIQKSAKTNDRKISYPQKTGFASTPYFDPLIQNNGTLKINISDTKKDFSIICYVENSTSSKQNVVVRFFRGTIAFW